MLLALREERYRYLSIGVDRVLIMRKARIHCVSMLSKVCGMRPVRFLETRSTGGNDVPIYTSQYIAFATKLCSGGIVYLCSIEVLG